MTTTTPMTAEEFYEWACRPENVEKMYELDRGQPVLMPPTDHWHGVVCARIGSPLWDYAQTRGRGYACIGGSGLIVSRNPDTVRGPDLYLCDKRATLAELKERWPEEPPTLVAEVQSALDPERWIRHRLEEYLRWGVPMVWLVHARERFVTVYRAGHIPATLDEADEIDGQDVLPDFRCCVAEFFTMPS